MRKLLMVLIVLLGLVSIAMTARYGWKQADNDVDRLMSSIMYGAIALCAIFFDAMAIRVWGLGGRKIGGAIGAIAGLAFVVTFSNSLGSIASRFDAVAAERQSASDARADNRRELARLEAALDAIGQYNPTDGVAVDAARAAAEAAERARRAECGNGDPRERGKYCRAYEATEKGARERLTDAAGARATTDRAKALEGQIRAVRGALSGPGGAGEVNPLAAVLSHILPGLGAGIASFVQAAIALVFELCIVGMMIGYEALGPTGHELVGKSYLFDKKPNEIDTLPPGPSPKEITPLQLERPRPKLAVANKQPVGAILDFLHDGVEIKAGPRTEMTDAYIGYATWCRSGGRKPMGVPEFVGAMESACREFGIRMEADGDCLYIHSLAVKLSA